MSADIYFYVELFVTTHRETSVCNVSTARFSDTLFANSLCPLNAYEIINGSHKCNTSHVSPFAIGSVQGFRPRSRTLNGRETLSLPCVLPYSVSNKVRVLPSKWTETLRRISRTCEQACSRDFLKIGIQFFFKRRKNMKKEKNI